jgi:hypothetical protein
MRGHFDNPMDLDALEAWMRAHQGQPRRIIEVHELAATEFVIQGNELLLSPVGYATLRRSMALDEIEAN